MQVYPQTLLLVGNVYMAITMNVLNLTQHTATGDQALEGVREPSPELKAEIRGLLTFDELPSGLDIGLTARELATIASEEGLEYAMIGGAPFLMAELERHLRLRGVKPLYAFSQRESVEVTADDGSVTKTNVFKHVGFVEV
jgi:hypothetical protein